MDRTEQLATLSIEEASEAGPELVAALGRLVPQLSRSAPVPSWLEVQEMVACPTTILLVARVMEDPRADGPDAPDRRDGEGSIVGTLTLAIFRIPTGMRAWIEDVVVDASARGLGVGEALTAEGLRRAAQAGARSVDLTSRPTREAANRLYGRLGFAPRETNVYRYQQPG